MNTGRTQIWHRLPVLAAIALAVAIPSLGRAQMGGPNGSGSGATGYKGVGSGMMGGSTNNVPVTAGWGGAVLTYSQAKAFIQYSDNHGTASGDAKTVSFDGTDITIDLIAVQPGFPDQTFEVHSLAGPTLIVPRGATVHMNLLNTDYGNNMEHTVLVTTSPPPYPYMTTMSVGQPVVPPMPELPWRSGNDVQTAQYAAAGISFVASAPGTYWYYCPAPEHAEKGMYGKLIAR